MARTAFPLAIIAAIGTSITLLNGGMAPDTVTVVVIAGSYFWIALLERLCPLHPEWSHDKGDLKADIGLGLTNAALNGIAQPLFVAFSVGIGTWLATHYGAQVWPDDLPLIVQLIPALLLGELIEYSFHRAYHEVSWLWPIHAPHHSANRLYWFNALRFHPIDILAIGPGKLIPLVILGADGGVIALVGVFSAVHGIYQHANLPCRLGPLNWVFSMAELHRWHHSPNRVEANHNYGGNLIFWDIVFGTRFLPKDREPPVEIGIAELPNFPQDYVSLLATPFRWTTLSTRSGPQPRPVSSNE
ncbi:sterol desaturase family protein [Myxococcota bacterium]|nr:sterol desaturase family protein [Myxococcota bacterium]